MLKKDDNQPLLPDQNMVDKVNAAFYSRFPYPQAPFMLTRLEDPDFERAMLNQDIGDYTHKRIPRTPNIWVAGCGTNQAVITALRFPKARVLGSDLSAESLSCSRKSAELLRISNLNLKNESINEVSYKNEFDFIVCTGVIHHNANPAATLAKLGDALAPHGILELMVYNGLHWSIPASFQKIVHLFGSDTFAFDSKLALGRKLLDALPLNTDLSRYINRFKNVPVEVFADVLLQPVLHGYTIESLAQMAEECGLSLVTQCVNVYNKINHTLSWETKFDDAELQRLYDKLPDIRRWEITNHATRDKSQYLWFYLDKKAAGSATESRRLTDAFLETPFQCSRTTIRHYTKQADGSFSLSANKLAYPGPPGEAAVRNVLNMVDGRMRMKKVLEALNFPNDFQSVNDLRIRCATSAFPYLVSAAGTSE